MFSQRSVREIPSNIHFCDTDQLYHSKNRLHMIRLVLDYLQAKFMELFYSYKEISVDECMISFKGQISWIQRMPQKPVKVGFKVFVLADSQTGYCWTLDIYVGKANDQQETF